MKAEELEIGELYDFTGQLEEGSYQGWIDEGEKSWTGYFVEIEKIGEKGEEKYKVHFKQAANGCSLILTVDKDYNDFFKRPYNGKNGTNPKLDNIRKQDLLYSTCIFDSNSNNSNERRRNRKSRKLKSRRNRKTRKN